MTIGKLYVLIYSIIVLVFAIYIVATPIASVIEFDGIIKYENWFNLNKIPYGTLLSAAILIAAIVLIAFSIKSIICHKCGSITTGFAISTLMYTATAVFINYSTDLYVENLNSSVTEHGVAWHALLVLMIVNTVHLGIVLVIRNARRKYE